MTYNEHVRDCAAKELGLLDGIIDMIERDVDKDTMLTTLRKMADRAERKAGIVDGKEKTR